MIYPVPPRGATGATGPAGATGATGATGAAGPATRIFTFSQAITGASDVWTNQAAALQEFLNDTNRRVLLDLSNTVEARLGVSTSNAGASTAELAVQYSTDNGSTWAYLDGSSGPSCSLATVGLTAGAWVNVATAAKTSVQLRVVGSGGNGVADPTFRRVQLETR